MNYRRLSAAAAALFWGSAIFVRAASPVAGPAPAAVPTFAKDVAPILYKNCTTCHRPGEIAPMSLLTYEDARPYAKAMRDEVSDRTMPPWHADAPHGTFLNERGLTDDERDTIVKWANGGAPKGDAKDLPPVPEYAQGWGIGKPDAIFEMQEDYPIPADGVVQYEWFYIPTDFTEAKLVKAIEVRPGNRGVVHHVLVYYRAKPDLARQPVMQPNREHNQLPQDRTGGQRPPKGAELPARRLLATYAPGTNPQVMPEGTALRLEPGGVIELQMHYTTNGKAGTDRTKIGFVFSKEAAPKEVRASQFFNAKLELPAGANDVAVTTDATFAQDTTVMGLFPHTHLRGKKWEYVLELPDGTKKTILSVPKYDFNWQTYYMFKEPLQVPKGSRIVSTAWYDNSPGNKSNPDPKSNVKWGDQTWEEMQYTGILFIPSIPPTPITAPGGKQ
jgi:hypothetical protein